MTPTGLVRGYRLAGAALIVSAAVHTLVVKWDEPTFSLGNFFSYFTNLSNFLAAAVLSWSALRAAPRSTSERFELLRGAATLYMAVTGLVYALLLSGYDSLSEVTPPHTNWIMHRIMPVVMVADWLFVPPRRALVFRRTLVWLAFPVVYLAYTLIRGPIVDWYPYPFLDPTRDGGYPRVALACTVIAAGFVGLTWLLTWAGNRLRDRQPRGAGQGHDRLGATA